MISNCETLVLPVMGERELGKAAYLWGLVRLGCVLGCLFVWALVIWGIVSVV